MTDHPTPPTATFVAVAASGTLARPRRRAAAAPPRRSPGIALVLAGCIVLAALSLLGPSAPTYDPWAWLNWGRQISDGGLDTVAGPSWKPLPVALTAAFALVDDGAAPSLWLLVARAGGLLAIAMAYRLADPAGGARSPARVAAASLVLANGFVSSFARGNSEGLLVGLVLWAIERHLDGRRRQAFLLAAVGRAAAPGGLAVPGRATASGSCAPSGGTGIRAPSARARRRSGRRHRAAVVRPRVHRLGQLPARGRRARATRWRARRARRTIRSSPSSATRRSALLVPVYAGALVAVAAAARAWRRDRGGGTVLALAALTTAYMVIVGVLAEAGFTGNLRYVTLPAAVVCVLAGVGWAQVVAWARATPGRAATAVAVAAIARLRALDRGGRRRSRPRPGPRAVDRGACPTASRSCIDEAGGRRAVQRCGPVFTGPLEVQLVAWYLRVPSRLHRLPAAPAGRGPRCGRGAGDRRSARSGPSPPARTGR